MINNALAKRKGLIYSSLIISAVLALAVLSFNIASSSPLLSAEKAREMIDKGEVDLILDVRTQQEFDGPYGHLKGAKLIPIQVLQSKLDEISQYKDKTVLIYCHSGVRSMHSTKILEGAGFGKVLDLQGGIVNWRRQGF